jgi:hypothetical protein
VHFMFGSAGRSKDTLKNGRNGGSNVLHGFLLLTKLIGSRMKRMKQLVCSDSFQPMLAI